MGYEAKPVFFYEPSNSTPQIKEVMESFLKAGCPDTVPQMN
jgi:hypothetical protein